MVYFPLYPILNIITIILNFVYKNPPFIKNYYDIFPQAYNIEKNSNTIINEFNEYYSKYEIIPIKKTNPGFIIENSSKEENAWRGLFLKKTGKINNEMIKYFPKTINLLKNDEIHSAFFSILDPEVEIPPHIGYYKGYLRYHIGIVIPNNEINDINKKPYIVCGNERYYWKTGEGVMFDDMYLHYVKNPTQNMRCVLYLDIKRKSDNILIT
jgi:beta-hydroxylase